MINSEQYFNNRKLNISINLQKSISVTTHLVQYIYEKDIDIV
jgi:hypothetical protein